MYIKEDKYKLDSQDQFQEPGIQSSNSVTRARYPVPRFGIEN